MRMMGVLRGARFLAEALLDLLRPPRRVPRVPPGSSPKPSRLHRRLRAVSLLLRIVEAMRIPWSCRRTAFAVYRALAREGVRARLCFGIRRARPDEPRGGPYVGHVWACRGGEPSPAGYPLRIVLPAIEENAGWRRG